MHRNIIDEIFRDLPFYIEYFAYKSTLPYYDKIVNNQLFILEKVYHKTKNALNVIDNEFDNEKKIFANT